MRIVLALLLIACSPRGLTSSLKDGTGGAASTTRETPVSAFVKGELIIDDPLDGAVIDAATIAISGRADASAAQIFVQVGPNAPLRATSSDGNRHFSVSSPLAVGAFPITAVAYGFDGSVVDTSDIVHITRPGAASDDQPPSITLETPDPKFQPITLKGTTSDDRGVVRMTLDVDGLAITDAPFGTSDFFAHWVRALSLTPGVSHTVTVTAYDAAGNSAQATLTFDVPTAQDRDPPQLDATATTTLVSGTAQDASGISAVKVRVNGGAWVLASYDVASATFSLPIAAPFGTSTIDIRAIDSAGLITEISRQVENTEPPEYGAETRFTLRDRTADPRPHLALALDEPDLKQLIDLDTRKQIRVLDIDPSPLLDNALATIMDSCGTDWKNDKSNPTYNCAGQGYANPWQSSAEYSLVRLLTMTPANADVSGTSLSTLADIADALDISGGFGSILASALGISRTSPIVPRAQVVTALRDYWMGSHPNVTADKKIPVSLHDVLEDMAPLSTVLGPAGGHPGVLDAPPHAVLFNASTTINLAGTSNLRWMDGVHLGAGKDYFARADQAKVLSLDFDNGFSIDNMASQNPAIDLRFKIYEDAAWIPACTGDSCKNNVPPSNVPAGNPRGVWAKEKWKLEPIVTYASYLKYKTYNPADDHVFHWDIWILGDADIWIEQTSWAQAWTRMSAHVIGISLSAPDPQYIWELIDEVAQQRLHHPIGGGAIAEGAANAGFTLKNVATGLTGPVIVNGVREQLRTQESFLIDRMLGNWRNNNGAVDFYYRRGVDGLPYLVFVAQSDPRNSGHVYSYTSPGFFSDPALNEMVGGLALDGSSDNEHLMYALTAGEHTFYVQGQDGKTYRVRASVPAGSAPSIDVAIAERLAQ